MHFENSKRTLLLLRNDKEREESFVQQHMHGSLGILYQAIHESYKSCEYVITLQLSLLLLLLL